jgi:hypothetical protein
MASNATGPIATRVHYAVEYIDRSGRRRRARKATLRGAESFKKHLRMGSDPTIRLVTRKVKAA